jgi:hypothetical protein
MVAVRKTKPAAPADDDVFEDADALIALARESFAKAARAEVAMNDRLGIATHGAVNGEIVTRQPPKSRRPTRQ